jgi:hypothetical protein
VTIFLLFSKLYPLFICKGKLFAQVGEEASLTESGLSNLGVALVDSVKKLPFKF